MTSIQNIKKHFNFKHVQRTTVFRTILEIPPKVWLQLMEPLDHHGNMVPRGLGGTQLSLSDSRVNFFLSGCKKTYFDRSRNKIIFYTKILKTNHFFDYKKSVNFILLALLILIEQFDHFESFITILKIQIHTSDK